MRSLFVVGSGGFASEVLFAIERINEVETKWSNIFLIDDNNALLGTKVRNYKIVGDIEYLIALSEEMDVVVTINNPETRKEIIDKIINFKSNVHFPNIYDPNSLVDYEYINIGKGNIVMHYVILSTNLNIGDFNIFNSYTGIGHDSIIGDFNSFNPRVAISGNVRMNHLNSFGLNSAVVQNKKIGSKNQVWINTIIVKNLKDNGTYFGVPGKKIAV